jgi:hypothetical protein
MRYTTATAFRAALEARLHTQAQTTNRSLQHLARLQSGA